MGERGDDDRKALAWYLRYSHLGIQFFLALAIPIGLGIWLDSILKTKVLFMLLGFALGFTAGIYSIYGALYRHRDGGPRRKDGGAGEGGPGKSGSSA